MNVVALVGRLTRDPSIRETRNGQKSAWFTLAVDRRYNREEADFISCIAFGKRAEFIEQYVNKGLRVSILGQIQTGQRDRDGRTEYFTNVLVDNIEIAQSRAESDAGGRYGSSTGSRYGSSSGTGYRSGASGGSGSSGGNYTESNHNNPKPDGGDLPFEL